MRFSTTTGCFYPDDIQYPNLPGDLIEVTDAGYSAAMNRASGDTFDVVAGCLVIVPKPAPTDSEIEAEKVAVISVRLNKLRFVREDILNRLGGIAGRADRKGDKATADACDVATQGLLDITKDLPAELEAIELVVVARYKAIVTTAAITAPGLVSAFVGVDL